MSDPLVGSRIWSCEIQKRLGSGGMGSVYLARHLDLDKPVAVKVMARELLSSEDHVRRFRREAQLAAKLEHPNVVTIHHVGEQDGLQFIVMQFVDGRTLEELLSEKGKLSLGEAVAIVKRVAYALAAAHKLGIVHRDIKPANILVSRDGIVKVADFGLARPGGEGNQSISATGQIVGTPSYMSPEQAQGGLVDGRSDFYSLGATFYHLVTGRRCFEGDTPLSIVLKHIQETPVEPHVVNAELPPSVSRVVLKMMAKDPAARYANAEELIRDLDLLKADLTSRRPATGAVAASRVAEKTLLAGLPAPKQTPWALLAVVGGLLIVSLGATMILRGGRKDPAPSAVAVVPPAKPGATPVPSATPSPVATPSPAATPTPVPLPTLPEGRRPYAGSPRAELAVDLAEKFKDAKDLADAKELWTRFQGLARAAARRDREEIVKYFAPLSGLAKEKFRSFLEERFPEGYVLDLAELQDVTFSRIKAVRGEADLLVELRWVRQDDDRLVRVMQKTWTWHQLKDTWYLSIREGK